MAVFEYGYVALPTFQHMLAEPAGESKPTLSANSAWSAEYLSGISQACTLVYLSVLLVYEVSMKRVSRVLVGDIAVRVK